VIKEEIAKMVQLIVEHEDLVIEHIENEHDFLANVHVLNQYGDVLMLSPDEKERYPFPYPTDKIQWTMDFYNRMEKILIALSFKLRLNVPMCKVSVAAVTVSLVSIYGLMVTIYDDNCQHMNFIVYPKTCESNCRIYN